MRLAAAAVLAALAVAAPAAASEEHPTQAEVEAELVCPVCAPATLDQSDAPVARRMKALIAARIAAGDTKSEIKRRLVADFGRRVLATPPKQGFDLLAWLLPLAGIGLAGAAVGVVAWRWTRRRDDAAYGAVADPAANGRVALEPELARRLDEALTRFDG